VSVVDPLHDGEWVFGERDARRLVDAQFPQWSTLSLRPAGAGTDNRMYRLGDEYLVRLPRTEDTARNVEKEQAWLPRLAPHLPVTIPEPVGEGVPDSMYPFPWSIYRWIDGHQLDARRVEKPERLGIDLADFVDALERTDLMGARRIGDLSWYRGGPLRDMAEVTDQHFAVADRLAPGLDLASLRAMWQEALAAGDPCRSHTWMHADLRPANLVENDGRLAGVVDFGGLSIGEPTCEHAAVWDLPAPARLAYGHTLGLDEATRVRARGWALTLGLGGIAYYSRTWPEFARECRVRLEKLLTEPL
jgi:aminoglycoside phosphotransferase (APT) family kinase protein